MLTNHRVASLSFDYVTERDRKSKGGKRSVNVKHGKKEPQRMQKIKIEIVLLYCSGWYCKWACDSESEVDVYIRKTESTVQTEIIYG